MVDSGALVGQCEPVTPDETVRFYLDFGRRVRAARVTSGLTQQGLADALGLTRSSVANIEAGRQRVLLHVPAAIAAATRTALTELLPGEAEVTPLASIARDLRGLSVDNREAVEHLLRRTVGAAG